METTIVPLTRSICKNIHTMRMKKKEEVETEEAEIMDLVRNNAFLHKEYLGAVFNNKINKINRGI